VSKDPVTATTSSVDRTPRRGNPPKRKSPSKMPDLGDLKITKQDIKKFSQLLKARGGVDDLYRAADKIQANAALSSALSIQQIYEMLCNDMFNSEEMSVDDAMKLINALKGSVNAVNQSMKYLGLSGADRKEQKEGEPLAATLARMAEKQDVIPGLEQEFLLAKKDMDITEAKLEDITEKEKEDEKIKLIKEPIKTFHSGEEDRESKVIDMDLQPVKEIG